MQLFKIKYGHRNKNLKKEISTIHAYLLGIVFEPRDNKTFYHFLLMTGSLVSVDMQSIQNMELAGPDSPIPYTITNSEQRKSLKRTKTAYQDAG